MCRAILKWMLELPGLQVPADVAKPGERCMANQSRQIHTLFGQIELQRNYYYSAAEGSGRFPLDDAFGRLPQGRGWGREPKSIGNGSG